MSKMGLARAEQMSWDASAKWGVLPADAHVEKGENLFPRIDMEKELAALAELQKPKKEQINECTV